MLALVAFAANSVLCRLALKSGAIDALSFTQARLLSGAVFLAVLVLLRGSANFSFRVGHIFPALALIVYAVAFSFSYITLDAGVGALILFGCVQFTMIGAGLLRGDRPAPDQWAGVALAFGGLLYLMAPGTSAPPVVGAVLMGIAGLAWGAYSLYGRGETDPALATARNFLLVAPIAVGLFFIPYTAEMNSTGLWLAVASGALASGAGYVIWYAALPSLSRLSASVVQLCVPVIAAFGGVLFIGEAISLRLIVSSLLILGGIFLAVRPRRSVA